MKHDIVYILKNDIEPEELRYSVRSVEKNFTYSRIWFAGGIPDGIKPDRAMPIEQTGASKWEKVRNTLIEICNNDEITEDFWLFNDDFFVMKKVKDQAPMIAGTIRYRIDAIEKKYNRRTKYSNQLRNTMNELRSKGFDRLDYALHVPMLINRAKALETLEAFPDCPMFRSLYGNQHRIGGVIAEDVKVLQMDEEPPHDSVYLSTLDETFRDGRAGQYIRDKFKVPSQYER